VLAQTIEAYEIVVVDDGSTDRTVDVIPGLMDARVRYRRQDNAGASVARNTGASMAQGRWLVFLDDDDEVRPTWLAGLRNTITPQHAVVCCAAEHVDLETGSTKIVSARDMGPAYDGFVALFDTGTFAVRRDAFESLGGYAVGLSTGTHKEFALRLLPLCTKQGWSVGSTGEVLVRVNQRRRETRARSHPRNLYEGAVYLLEHHGARLARSPALLASRYGVAGVNAARMGDFADARSMFTRAIRAEPRRFVHYGRLALSLVPPAGARIWGRPEIEADEQKLATH
jgi:glycosyltransferase involved in cell wall biosynthesis